MMNQDTRRLSKMPKDVLDEISTYFLDQSVIKDDDRCQRIKKLTDSAPYIRSNLVVSLMMIP
jgi:fatty acyl-ACP thioesterase B